MNKITFSPMAGLRRIGYYPRSVVFALLAVLLTTAFEYSDVFRRIDYDMSDMHMRAFAPTMTFENVVIVDVDEESMTRLRPTIGSWPYDREVYALVTDYLLRAGALAVAYDVLFSEARKGDDAFAAVLDERVVLAAAALPYTLERDAAYQRQLLAKSWGEARDQESPWLETLALVAMCDAKVATREHRRRRFRFVQGIAAGRSRDVCRRRHAGAHTGRNPRQRARTARHW